MFLLPISSTRSISLSTLFFTTVASFWLLGFVLAQDSIYKNMLWQIEKCEYAAQEKVWHSFSGQLPTPIQGGLRRSTLLNSSKPLHFTHLCCKIWRNFTLLIDILPLFCSYFVNFNIPALIFTNKLIGPKEFESGKGLLRSCSTWKGP